MVTDSLQRDEDAEWKFARTKLYMDYIQQGDTIAVRTAKSKIPRKKT